MPVNIKRAGVEDAAIIAPLFDAYRIFYGQAGDVAAAENFIKERLLSNESVIFLAFEDKEAIAFTQLYPIFTSVGMQRAWLLNDLFVYENARGKGIAMMLLESAKQHGRSTNSKWLMLQTHHDNYIAHALYQRNGWIKENDVIYLINV
ncbi:MAG: GNAT family N-acetyltransferase [Parafilimonas sp.]